MIPVLTPILTDTWELLVNYHFYEADALQSTTYVQDKDDAVVSGDERLVETAGKAGLTAFHVTKDEPELKQLLLLVNPTPTARVCDQ